MGGSCGRPGGLGEPPRCALGCLSRGRAGGSGMGVAGPAAKGVAAARYCYRRYQALLYLPSSLLLSFLPPPSLLSFISVILFIPPPPPSRLGFRLMAASPPGRLSAPPRRPDAARRSTPQRSRGRTAPNACRPRGRHLSCAASESMAFVSARLSAAPRGAWPLHAPSRPRAPLASEWRRKRPDALRASAKAAVCRSGGWLCLGLR